MKKADKDRLYPLSVDSVLVRATHLMAGRPVSGGHLPQRRALAGAFLGGVGAPGVEGAARGRAHGGRDLPLEEDALPAAAGPGSGTGTAESKVWV